MNDLRSVDLNLLVVLDALLDEAHVTRAAARLGLSQPAASNALDRLRHLFGDALLERGRGGMRLTPAAEALRGPLKAALASVEAVLRPSAEDPATVRRTVRLVVADALAGAVAGLHARLCATAPGVALAVLPWRGAAEAVGQLARGEAELVASVLPPLDPALFRRTTLLQERYLVAMRRDHPAAARFDLDSWLAHPHLVVSGRGEAATPLDAELAARGLSRRVGVVVPSFLMVPPLLLGSDLIAMVPRACVPRGETAPLAAFPPPIPVDGFCLHLAWHSRREGDVAVRHVAGELAAVLRSRPEPPGDGRHPGGAAAQAEAASAPPPRAPIPWTGEVGG